MKKDVSRQVPGLEVRFIPYIQLHEFEGLLFRDPGALSEQSTSLPLVSGSKRCATIFRHRRT
jgi:hypothetical protein